MDLIDQVLGTLPFDASQDERLEGTQQLRTEMVREILSTGGNMQDSSMITAAKGLLADIDKSVLAQRRMKQDDKNQGAHTQMLGAVYQDMISKHGRDVELNVVSEAVVLDFNAVVLPTADFDINEDELRTGLDTDSD